MLRASVVTGLIALVLSYCSWVSGGDDRDQYLSDGTIRIIPPGERGNPVTMDGTDLDGNPLTLPKGRSRATVLNIWWSGCAACRQEAPRLRTLAADPTVRADFLGIDVRESSQEAARRFEEKAALGYRSFYDPGGTLLLQLRGKASLASIPTTVVLDARHRVAAVLYGEIPRKATLAAILEDVLAG